MPTADTIIQRARRFIRDYPDEDSLNASCTSTATTITVPTDANDSYFKNQLIEIEEELLRVTAVATTTTLTVQRAVQGTTAASHANSATILLTPRFAKVEYLDALGYAMDSVWPWVYKPVVDTSITLVTDQYEYDIPRVEGHNLVPLEDSTFDAAGVNTAQFLTGGTNTLALDAGFGYPATSGAKSGQSLKCTFQDNGTLMVYQTGPAEAIELTPGKTYRFRVKTFIDTDNYSGTVLELRPQLFGDTVTNATTTIALTNETWVTSFVDLLIGTSESNNDGSLYISSTGASANDFIHVDELEIRELGERIYVQKVEAKVPGADDYSLRRRWWVDRDTQKIVFKYLDEADTTLKVTGFAPFSRPAAPNHRLDAVFPARIEWPLVEFVGSYLLASGEAGRTAVDRGLIDGREQANRVGSSMQASNALLARFERKIRDLGMPPPAHYPHVVPTL